MEHKINIKVAYTKRTSYHNIACIHNDIILIMITIAIMIIEPTKTNT